MGNGTWNYGSWWSWLKSFFNRTVKEPAPTENYTPKAKRAPRTQKQDIGTFYTLGTVLDDLDTYFKSLRLFKREDPASYALFAKVGAPLVGDSTGLLFHRQQAKLEPFWRAHRPTFGAVFLAGSKHNEGDYFGVDLIYFKKFNRRHGVIMLPNARADLYEVGVFYKHASKNIARAISFYVYVTEDGAIHPVQTKRSEYCKLKKGGFNKTIWEYGLPDALLSDWRKREGCEHITAEDIAKCLFAVAANYTVLSPGGFQVRVKRGNVAALFNIDMLRTPYFFKDRDRTVTINGNSKKIFHIVRTHKRTRADGTERFVKSHLRGERKFTWNGYDVTVSLPGKNHIIVQELEDKLYTEDDIEGPIKKDQINLEDAADKIAAHLEH